MIKLIPSILLFLSIFCGFTGAQQYTKAVNPSFSKQPDGITFKIMKQKPTDPQLLKIQVCTESIIRVVASPSDSLSTKPSLMVNVKEWKPVKWSLKEEGNLVEISTNKITVTVDTTNGRIEFYNSSGQLILKEIEGGGKIITPAEVMGHKTYHIQQIFNSPEDEAFYGLGQQQEGLFNYKDHDVDLYQYNTKISIPFVISNKNYGILWDNYSYSKFGDIHDYSELSLFKLFNAEGKEGGLTADYYNSTSDSTANITIDESQINYEFIPALKNLPNGFQMKNGKVIWSGSLEPDSSGLYKFRLYAAGHCKLWIDNKLIVDRWRQSWNAFVHLFDFQLEKGKKYPVRIEWIPEDAAAYISLKVKAPISKELQNDLSLYSDYAHQIDYYFISGKNINQVISGYRQLTGKALIPPKWAFGFWQSRERYQTQDELLGVAREYRKLKIPFDNIVQDWFYWKEDQWGIQQFDSSRYPHPKAMIHELHNKLHEHFMISVWPKFYVDTKRN
ncbi:MAG: DUF4968 domain-containing protein [Bacteroidetes bacterium]|nr:DUF4968 domain-containing protein [Bacteroidota bacterium]